MEKENPVSCHLHWWHIVRGGLAPLFLYAGRFESRGRFVDAPCCVTIDYRRGRSIALVLWTISRLTCACVWLVFWLGHE